MNGTDSHGRISRREALGLLAGSATAMSFLDAAAVSAAAPRAADRARQIMLIRHAEKPVGKKPPYGITVNNIAPGPIMTDRLSDILAARANSLGVAADEQLRRLSQTIPVRRPGQPNEIGDLCAYLCSVQAGYLTGQTIVVDGGINRSI